MMVLDDDVGWMNEGVNGRAIRERWKRAARAAKDGSAAFNAAKD